jgi:hypothetical protein
MLLVLLVAALGGDTTSPSLAAEGQKCTLKSGMSCTYGDCGSMTFGCEGGKWKVTAANGPPPSARSASPPQGMTSETTVTRTNADALPVASVKEKGPPWQQCNTRARFECMPRSQGAAPPRGESVPLVCGCAPRCPRARPVLIAREARGRWPDGSRKAAFMCAKGGIPASRPPDR